MLRNFLVRGNEWCKAVGLGIGDNESVERVAGPLLVERRIGNFYKGKAANPDAEFRFDFPLNVARRQLPGGYPQSQANAGSEKADSRDSDSHAASCPAAIAAVKKRSTSPSTSGPLRAW